MSATIEMYTNKQKKQFPTIKIVGDGPKAKTFPLTMGLVKCRLVLAHLNEIKNFVEEFKEYKPTPVAPNDDALVLE